MFLPQVLQRGWLCLLSSHQHGNIRPQVQLFLLVLFVRKPSVVPQLLLPALQTFNTTSYQVRDSDSGTTVVLCKCCVLQSSLLAVRRAGGAAKTLLVNGDP